MEPPGGRLRVRGLGHAFAPGREALREFDLDLRGGEIVGLLGPNGSGKSTALALIAGLLPRRSGTLAFEGRALASNDRGFRARLGVVFQQPSVDRKLSARENLLLTLGMHGIRGRAAAERAREQLELAELADRADEPLKNLSGGMRRRVDLVRAVAHGPSLLLLDEPTSGLDELSFRRMWAHLERLRERSGLSILVATHRPDEAARCDRLLVLDEGKTVANETPSQLVARLAEDVVRVRAAGEPSELASELRATLGLAIEIDGRELVVSHPRGHELIVRIVESVARGRIDAITVQRPTLADVFLHLTGRSLEREVGEGKAA
ncbi:ABC transporter ATP-binding protein [Nannocystaceae bacterium ST9]